ncbi:MAG TPA: universal stress protein [Chlorobaculum sp.]|uniref:Universal stress protein family n=1 Tax=Chlorobaculum tepidum (strain ATCC 49652 / DSM 12025 / NBRC 103806 / TLS) TaxID=194439 RepID=Q8KG62_CHLTE|nr:universal stress protein [Chlorobaculum tepidum]AAM71354.1 universal stress protein family [Chlorobaculum tepidum TLS]HBU24364.1 universal stress protein [Chlorobaculum sp.]
MTTNHVKPSKIMLCPVDFSPSSERALLYAAEHCPADAELIVLYVGDAGNGDRGTMLREHLHQFSSYSDLLSAYGCRVRFAVEYGSPGATIIEYASKTGAAMIVLGSHGASNLGRLLVGSTAESVMRHAPCPVLVLRSPEGVNETGTVQRKQKEAIL